MTNTGRTVSRWVEFHIGVAANANLAWIPIDTLSAVGCVYDETDLTAWMDAVKGSLPNMPDAPIEISGPWDSTASTGNDTAMSGSHAVLAAIMAAQVTTLTPLTLDIRIGVRHTWITTEPQFGITATSISGYWLKDYTFDAGAGKYNASFRLFPGSSLPGFGTSDETT